MMKPKKESNGNSNWKSYAYEMLYIILGVLVALGIDEWAEDRQNAERAQIAIHNIQREISDNLGILETAHPRNLAAYAIIEADSSEHDSATITPALQLQSTAWTMLQESGVGNFIEYDTLIRIAQLYSIQTIYIDISQQFMRQYMETKTMAVAMGRELKDDDIIQANLEVLGLMVSVEGQLKSQIEKYLQENVETENSPSSSN